MGDALYNKQSFEAPKTAFDTGSLDGKIASGGTSFPGSRLNEQTSTMWAKQDFQQGQTVTAGWCLTAAHKTASFQYYITKKGWNPDKPLTRDSFEKEPLSTVDGNNQAPVSGLHRIPLPADRTGYHVILAKWNVGDTANAFYNVMDVTVKGDSVGQKPSAPTGLHDMGVTAHQVDLMWNPAPGQDKVTGYEVWRDDKKIADVKNGLDYPVFKDAPVSPDTRYTYKIRAVNTAGESAFSNTHTVTTAKPSSGTPVVSQAWLVKKDDGQTLVSVKGTGEPGAQVFVKAKDGSWSDRKVTVGRNGEFAFVSGYFEQDGVTVQLRKDGQEYTSAKAALQAAPATITTPADGSEVGTAFTVTGTGEAGAEVTVKAGSTETKVKVKADKTWTATLTNVTAGAQQLTAVQTIDGAKSTATTRAVTVIDPDAPSLPAWDSRAAYTKGDRVTHDGAAYECVQSYQGVGDPNWITALSLWKPVTA
ncbi:lytic polysaccharide monooxygenase [Streptoverticillium reticulum]|uniref:lytic polysaccharide monooxygenase n=1 Tax=Streptoverticillium reticulum TaxID=1433415 RepID=UPI0039BF804D